MSGTSAIRFGKDIDKLDISDIEKLIDSKVEESFNLEYKQPTRNLDNDCDYLAKTISGFLNTSGGVLVYGVVEGKEDAHSYPTQVKWLSESKERLENIPLSRVQQWNEQVRIKRIDNRENRQEGIFVIDVPKSNDCQL